MKKRGITILEIMIAVAMLAVLIVAASDVITYARQETQRGYWLQQGVIQLRTGVRLLSDKLKKTSYPSTNVKTQSGVNQLFSFKYKREYDSAGRLRSIEENTDDRFDMCSLEGRVFPNPGEDISLLYFPVCEPETDNEPGKISWFQLVLRPDKRYKLSGLGELYLTERPDTYDTTGKKYRAFELKEGHFDEKKKTTQNRVIVSNVESVEIYKDEFTETHGTAVDASGATSSAKMKRILVTIIITVRHPTDKKLRLTEQCSIVNNVSFKLMQPVPRPELVSISNNLATIAVNKKIYSNLAVDSKIPTTDYVIKNIDKSSETVRVLNTKNNIEGYIVKHENSDCDEFF